MAQVSFSRSGSTVHITDDRFPGYGRVARRGDNIIGSLVTRNGDTVRAYSIRTSPATLVEDMKEAAGYVAQCMRGVVETLEARG
jgi:hypothetical protein